MNKFKIFFLLGLITFGNASFAQDDLTLVKIKDTDFYFDFNHIFSYVWMKTALNPPELINDIRIKQINTLIEVDCNNKTLNEIEAHLIPVDNIANYSKEKLEIIYNEGTKKLFKRTYLPIVADKVCK